MIEVVLCSALILIFGLGVYIGFLLKKDKETIIYKPDKIIEVEVPRQEPVTKPGVYNLGDD